MGRKSVTGGVSAKGTDRIEFTFYYRGKRYRPSLMRAPTEANLRRARVELEAIKKKIKAGTFSFLEREQPKRLTCSDVFRAFIAHCEMRVAIK
jgi:hypothetical protein